MNKTSWKTTLLGYTAAALNLNQAGINWKSLLLSIALAILGHVAKDYNVTGNGSGTGN